MTWKLHPAAVDESYAGREQLSEELVDRVMRGRLCSTYQEDYLGLPQGILNTPEEVEENPICFPLQILSGWRYSVGREGLTPWF